MNIIISSLTVFNIPKSVLSSISVILLESKFFDLKSETVKRWFKTEKQ